MPDWFVIANLEFRQRRQWRCVIGSDANWILRREASALRGVRIEPAQAGQTMVRRPGPMRFIGISCTGQRGTRTATMPSVYAALDGKVNAARPNFTSEVRFAARGAPRSEELSAHWIATSSLGSKFPTCSELNGVASQLVQMHAGSPQKSPQLSSAQCHEIRLVRLRRNHNRAYKRWNR
jgi:hypothetical protein